MQALVNQKITVFGGKQVRPNIHVQDITDVFLHAMTLPESGGIYNAGFENISILDIAEKVTKKVTAEIVVTESNDPRSYRLNSDKLLSTGFVPKYGVDYAIQELCNAYKDNALQDNDDSYNIRTMKKILTL